MSVVSPRIPEPPQGFTRTLVQVNYKTVIRSSCDYCGVMIAAVVAESVRADELEHREYCRSPKPADAATSGE